MILLALKLPGTIKTSLHTRYKQVELEACNNLTATMLNSKINI